jgi:cell division protein ZapB
MEDATTKPGLQRELKRLERRLDELVGVVAQPKEEDRAPRQRQDSLSAERATLMQKNEQVRARVEAMIGAQVDPLFVEYSRRTFTTEPVAFHLISFAVEPTRHLMPVVSFGVTISSAPTIWNSPVESAVTAYGSLSGIEESFTFIFFTVWMSSGITQA